MKARMTTAVEQRGHSRALIENTRISNCAHFRGARRCLGDAEEVERLEHQTGHALSMRPGSAQVIEDASIVSHCQAPLGEGGPKSIATGVGSALPRARG